MLQSVTYTAIEDSTLLVPMLRMHLYTRHVIVICSLTSEPNLLSL